MKYDPTETWHSVKACGHSPLPAMPDEPGMQTCLSGGRLNLKWLKQDSWCEPVLNNPTSARHLTHFSQRRRPGVRDHSYLRTDSHGALLDSRSINTVAEVRFCWQIISIHLRTTRSPSSSHPSIPIWPASGKLATMGAYIAKMLLPTVSSLVFLPAASVAAKRGFHMEAMVYFFTMFFTAIYHACDGPGLSIICFMKYDILEYFSVYGTAISIWVTLIALGDFDEPRRSTLTMFGILTCAVRIYQDRWGYGIYSGPIGSAVFIITVKWLQKMKEVKGLYPEKCVYTQQVGPGCCFGALALMLHFYFEEWDYAYVHSFYHLSMAVSFVLLLPKKNRYAGTDGNPVRLSCYTLLCCVGHQFILNSA
ncbi:hypothetical protein DPEC_G00124360 [Dallia pectoralis]|uniref:Uncharacterized protein n=1 Tax=Dallia pectoralis TaxID=75939 RepID=A0ACC2GR22_DALPE|nr:hypothetical protein DPEC_G00124360 [Dallia pectoralis]